MSLISHRQITPSAAVILIALHPKQLLAFTSDATEILYGGAAGGGKSHLMRMAAIDWCSNIPGLQVYLFRRIREDLVKNHMEGPKGFRELLAGWVACGFVEIVDDEIRFWNGSKIYLCHCKDEKDRFKYQGSEMHVLLVDEVTHFTEKIYRYLRGRVRMVGIKLPERYRGKFPRIIASGNPGGVGHQFVKTTWIDRLAPLTVQKMSKAEGGMLRQFIPAQLEDNPSMATDDPEYEDKLYGLGSEALVRALRFGDWDIVEGAFFDNFNRAKHVLKPFEVPAHWKRFRAGDWGSATPFAFGWFAIAEEDFIAGPGRVIPRGALVLYREWYGIKLDKDGNFIPNRGLKLTAEEVGKGLRARETAANENVAYGVLDPSACRDDGGPSIAHRIYRAGAEYEAEPLGVQFRPADNARVPGKGAIGGWDQVRSRLNGDGDGRPMLFIFDTCIHVLRTLPVLQHDEDRVEDLDTHAEDHAADMVRYGCMSKPYLRASEKPEKPTRPNDYKPANDTAEPGDWQTY